MKRFLICMVILFSILALSAWTVPNGVEVVSFDEQTNYMQLMYESAQDGSDQAMTLGAIYETQRNMKIRVLGLSEKETCFYSEYNTPEEIVKAIDLYLGKVEEPWYTEDDIRIVATVVYYEAWGGCSDRHRELVAAVVVNRVKSDLFPDTVYDVVAQKGQYHLWYATGRYKVPDEAWETCRDIAIKALNGEVECPENVVFQSNYSNLGSGYYEVHYTSYSTTYFSYY